MSDNNTTTEVLKMRGLLMYPRIFQPDNFYEEKWTLDLLLDKEGLKKAKEHGLRVHKTRTPKEGDPYDPYAGLFEGYDGSYLRIDRPTKSVNGDKRERPMVKDVTGRADVDEDTLIGNGTEANVLFIVKKRDKNGSEMSAAEAMKKYNGYGMFLTGVQIINLIPFERDGDPETSFIEEEGSFKAEQEKAEGFDFEKGDDLPFEDITAAG